MSLHNTNADIIEASGAAESLPDPTTVAGRTHRLHNDSAANQVWSSVGATPFSQGGINSATLTVPPGAAVNIYSSGTRWVVASGVGRQITAATGVTDASGNVTFTFPVPFAVTPVVTLAFQGAASQSPVDYRITAISTTSVTVNVRQSLATVIALLGLTLIAASLPLAGATIHMHATSPGATP